MFRAVYSKSDIPFYISVLFSMVVGSQLVHHKYKPLSDLDQYIEREIVSKPTDEQIKIRTAIQWKKDKLEKDISSLPPELQAKVKNAVYGEPA